jgi:CheY-like chemotaxis protein
MKDTKYCICCGEQVPYNRIERNQRIEFACTYCGFPLSAEDETPLTTQETNANEENKKFNCILVADDSRFTRKIINDMLDEKNLSKEIYTYENGLELTSAFSKFATEKKPVDVLILDINMPVMDGLTAARIVRSIETQNRLPHIPIAFFSSVKADDNLKKQMQTLAPANYVNKGTDPDPDKLAERVELLLSYFMKMKKS